jgi:hypothetical protein
MILMLPLLWAFRTFSQPSRRVTSRWVLALSSLFLINTEAILSRSPHLLFLTAHFPLLANVLLGPHLRWLLLSLSIILIISNLEETITQFHKKTIVKPETPLNLTSSTT